MIQLNHEEVLNMLKQSEFASKQISELRMKSLKELLKIAKEQNFKIKSINIG